MPHSGSGFSPGLSPSFNEYSSSSMADTAARVISELSHDPDFYPETDTDDVVLYSSSSPLLQNDTVSDVNTPDNSEEKEKEEEEEEDDDRSFEFPNEIFNSGQIRPLLPIFNTDLVFADTDWRVDFNLDSEFPEIRSPEPQLGENPDSIRLPLKKLMISERQSSMTESASCSSSEADDLEGLAPDSYCVWNPSKQEMRKKSKSTGSSKRWKFRDLLYRSQSDGGEAVFVFASKQQHSRRKAPTSGEAVKEEKAEVRREIDRKAPYRQDPVGFFSRMNGLSRTIQPF